jgi:Ser/Thr protein kinase RdoA (MazF antagonist)
MIDKVLPAYGFSEKQTKVDAFGKGLINHTWKLTTHDDTYILQRINDSVFKRPTDIADNIKLIKEYLTEHHPGYHFVSPISSVDDNEMIFVDGLGYFRLFPFVKGSHTIDVVETPAQAYEAASQFGRFTRLLSGIHITKLKITIPDFHNLLFRNQQFHHALKTADKERINESKKLTKEILSHADLIKSFELIKSNPAFRLRVTHHDTKISNILFDERDKGIAVIDLDTVMPGYFISDVGDMMRTYLSPVSEEEKDLEKIIVRDDFYKAIVAGYRDEMKDELSETEGKYFFYAGQFMIYMQALRFLTDHLNNDVYYGARYPGHNLRRAENQFLLLDRLIEKESLLTLRL